MNFLSVFETQFATIFLFHFIDFGFDIDYRLLKIGYLGGGKLIGFVALIYLLRKFFEALSDSPFFRSAGSGIDNRVVEIAAAISRFMFRDLLNLSFSMSLSSLLFLSLSTVQYNRTAGTAKIRMLYKNHLFPFSNAQ